MDATSLRTLLLIKAVEENDEAGAILPHADREAATRAALRRWPLPPGYTGWTGNRALRTHSASQLRGPTSFTRNSPNATR